MNEKKYKHLLDWMKCQEVINSELEVQILAIDRLVRQLAAAAHEHTKEG